jgi:selenocysteine-specific elongation factor
MQTAKHVIVGTAGHIDHGKSSLVQALTGTDPDRLEEEKRRGITIDLGFAFLDLPGVRIGFVDVPGHERFVRNMLAGVGGIDLVVLVIAADESVKPQTREHFDICRMLGISRGLVALTKSDLVDADALTVVRREIEGFVHGSFLERAPIIAVSAKTASGLDDLKSALRKIAGDVPQRASDAHFRLPIDRAFAMKGFGTVVTGTLVSGSVKVEDQLELYPLGKTVRVRGLHSGGTRVEFASAGQRTALNLAGVELEKIERGMVLAPAGAFAATQKIDTRLTLLSSARSLKNHARVHFHQGAAERIAEVKFLDAKAKLEPGESCFAQLRLDAPLLLLPSDRFTVRQFSPVVTIGGGVVLDAHPSRHKANDPATIAFLETLERAEKPEALAAILSSSRRELSLADIISRTGWTKAESLEAAVVLSAASRARVISEQPWSIASSKSVAESAAALRKAVDQFHAANPLSPGIPKQELRRRAGNPTPILMEAALADLQQSHAVAITGDVIKRANREIALSAEEARAKGIVEKHFRDAGLAAPDLEAILKILPVDPRRAQKLLQILLREKALIRVSQEQILHESAVKHLKALVASYKQKHGARLPIVAFKELTGVTRKYAIPLLEYLDREHVTRRAGDERVIL